MDNNFTKQVQEWLNTPASQRDYNAGAMMLLKLTGNKIMHHNLMLRPCEKNMLFIEYQLKKRLDFRKFKAGKRDDHDSLPDEIQALYVENLSIVQKMRELHLKLRTLSLENATCPDSERYPFLKELISLDKKLHSNWEVYDYYTGADGEKVLTEDLREQSRQAVRMINLNKGKYAKKPTEELKSKILTWYGKVVNPTEKLTADLKSLGIL